MATVFQFYEGYIDHTYSISAGSGATSRALSLTVPTDKVYIAGMTWTSALPTNPFAVTIHNQHYLITGTSPYVLEPLNSVAGQDFRVAAPYSGVNVQGLVNTMFMPNDQLYLHAQSYLAGNYVTRFHVFRVKNL